MAGPAILKVQVVVDASKAQAGIAGIGKSAEGMAKGGDKVKRSLGDMAKTAGKVVGAAALGGLVIMLKKGTGEQMDFLSGQAQLANGLKTTGNAANTSVKQMEDLASSIQNYSGQTDDSIVASEKLLLTFTNVGNKAGKNNDIFNQATKMTADMAAKMGGDASKYAVQLGKALNDPTKGITALTRVGVTFTAAQKKSIASMQKSGDTLGAQKIIMAELRKEFGGSAEAAGKTLPGQMQRAQRSFEDISQSLVAELMPALTGLADFLTKTVLPAFKSVMDFVMQHKTVFIALGVAVGVMAAAIKVATIVQTLFNVSLMTSPIFWIVAGIVALVAVIAIVVQRTIGWSNVFKALGRAATAVWNAVKTAFAGVLAAFQSVWNWLNNSPIAAVLLGPWRIAIGAIRALVQGGVSGVISYFTGLIGALLSILSKVFGIVTTPFRLAYLWVRNNVAKLWNGMTAVAGAIGRLLSGVFGRVTAPYVRAYAWVRNNVSKLWSGMSAVAGAISRYLAGVFSRITSPFSSGYTWVRNNIGKLYSAFSSVAGHITHALSGVFSAITAPFESAWNWIDRNIISKIKGAWNGVANAINSIHVSMTVPSNVVTKAIHLAGKGFTFDPPNVPTLASGGVFDSATHAIVGEAGREIVTPEALLRSIVQEGGKGGTTVINNFNISGALDADGVARQIEDLLTQRRRRTSGVRRIGAPVAGVTS